MLLTVAVNSRTLKCNLRLPIILGTSALEQAQNRCNKIKRSTRNGPPYEDDEADTGNAAKRFAKPSRHTCTHIL
jgi:hypothetical protein